MTVVTIAHRISTIADVDRVLIMDQGKLVNSYLLLIFFSSSGLFFNFCVAPLLGGGRPTAGTASG